MKTLLILSSFFVLLNGTITNWSGNQQISDIDLVFIPSGSFEMGSNKGYGDERPSHKVTLDDFLMSATEITQAQYEKVINLNPSLETEDESRPVDGVSWYDAVIFCNRLSKAFELQPCYNLKNWQCDYTKNGFRLPTEAEWEYAARGVMQYEYGTHDGGISAFSANYNRNEGYSTAVGSYPVNISGLYDMAGNVWEWCNDWYGYNYYNNSPENNPRGPQSGNTRSVRGGSWLSKWYECRASFRQNYPPDFKSSDLGFRVVRSP